MFIVIEGIDGAGTTTQAALYAQHLTNRWRPAHVTREPTDGPIGKLIRQVLRSEVELAPTKHGLEWRRSMAALFAADRYDHQREIRRRILRDGQVVISDRYDLSNMVYQGTGGGAPGEDPVDADMRTWIRRLNQAAMRPAATVVIDVSPEVAAERRRARGGPVEAFDEDERQRRYAAAYKSTNHHSHLTPYAGRVYHVNGDGAPGEVLEHIVAVLNPIVFASDGPRPVCPICGGVTEATGEPCADCMEV